MLTLAGLWGFFSCCRYTDCINSYFMKSRLYISENGFFYKERSSKFNHVFIYEAHCEVKK